MTPETIADLHRAERSLRSIIHDALREMDRLARTHGDGAALTAARQRYDRAAGEHVAVLVKIDLQEEGK